MEGIIYFAILLCSIAFAIIAIYISLLLKRVSDSMKTVGNTFEKVEKQLRHITPQLKESLSETGKLIYDANEKLEATDTLFDTVENLGTSVHSINKVYTTKRSRTSDEEIFKRAQPFIEGIKWSEAAVQLYSKWKRKKSSQETQLAKKEETNVIPLNQTRKEG